MTEKIPQTAQTSLLNWRSRIFLIVLVVWFVLALWSVGTFWEHLSLIKAGTAVYLGALGGEVILLIMGILHCFYPKIRTRKWALIFSVAVGLLILSHAAGLRGLLGAQAEQAGAESRLAENLAKFAGTQTQQLQNNATKQSKTIGAGNAARLAKDAIKDANKTAISSIAEFTKNGNQTILSRTIFPPWYINGGMYALLFGVPLVLLGILLYMAITDEDYDRDFDGVVDNQETEFPSEIDLGKFKARR